MIYNMGIVSLKPNNTINKVYSMHMNTDIVD